MNGLIVADTLISLEFERKLAQRRADRHYWSIEQENLALRQENDELLAQYNGLVMRYNALLQDRKQLAINYEKMRDIADSWEADCQRLLAWARGVEENGHPGRKK
jgi:hypothetical protein